MILRSDLRSAGAGGVDDGFQRPEIAVAHDLVEPLFLNRFSVRRKAEASQRIGGGGTPSRLMVKHSSSPFSRLAAACGYFCFHCDGLWEIFRKARRKFLPISASSRQDSGEETDPVRGRFRDRFGTHFIARSF